MLPAQSGTDITVVEGFFEALGAFDFDRLERMLTDDAIYQNYPLPAHHGREAVVRVLRLLTRPLDTVAVHVHHIAERDGFVLTERTDVLRGKLIDMEFWVCGTLEVRNGKVALWRDRFDMATAATQLLLGPFMRLLRR